MCGICAYIGNKTESCLKVLAGIEMLLNRGYDGLGIGVIIEEQGKTNNFLKCDKIVASDSNIQEFIDNNKNNYDGNLIMAHCRWGVVGSIYESKNVHPHIDYTDSLIMVHNGIIDNYKEIKDKLANKQIKFKSDTDSEVFLNLISYYHNHKNIPISESIIKATQNAKGCWTIILASINEPKTLYCVKHKTPLLIGYPDSMNYCMVSSELSGFSNYADNYFSAEEDKLIIIKHINNKIIFNIENIESKKIDKQNIVLTPSPFKYWMMKEIMEQPDSILKCCSNIKNGNLYFPPLKKFDKAQTKHLIILGCGSSYYASYYSSFMFKNVSNFETVSVFDGAEFGEYDIPKTNKNICVIFVSQSGETKDLIRCVQFFDKPNITTIGVINVSDSFLSKKLDYCLYTNCGRENAVASTKVLISQIVSLNMMAHWFANSNKIIPDLLKLPKDMSGLLESSQFIVEKILPIIQDTKSLFILGKGCQEYAAKESALKIKEIGYIHAEACSSSSLKHGPFSLIDENMLIIMINPKDKNYDENKNICEQIMSRGGKVLHITDCCDDDRNRCGGFEQNIIVPFNKSFSGLFSIILCQIISYHLSLIKSKNPDKPANLAKTVTV